MGASPASTSSPVAVIGMSGRFPDAPTLDAFWTNLANGAESIRTFSERELIESGEDAAAVRDPWYVPAGVLLEGIDLFDAGFFGMTPREAEITDPQQRLFLECCWEVMEDAGYDASRQPLRVGVFAGASMSNYLESCEVDMPSRVSRSRITAMLSFLGSMAVRIIVAFGAFC